MILLVDDIYRVRARTLMIEGVSNRGNHSRRETPTKASSGDKSRTSLVKYIAADIQVKLVWIHLHQLSNDPPVSLHVFLHVIDLLSQLPICNLLYHVFIPVAR